MPIFERLVDSLMMNGRNNGKNSWQSELLLTLSKSSTSSATKTPSKCVCLIGERREYYAEMDVLLQVLVDAIVNTGPREDSTRIGSQGTVRRQAVDVSPLRRVNQSIDLPTIGYDFITKLTLHKKTREPAFRAVKSIAECLDSFPSPNARRTIEDLKV
ncbi:ribosomal protein S5 [Lentinula raphanica]|nr:ribosomal protein S5 [Lentinula raphanica]KAJ3965111.1 ribosomal protein S5 [Lentinula raphanica]